MVKKILIGIGFCLTLLVGAIGLNKQSVKEPTETSSVTEISFPEIAGSFLPPNPETTSSLTEEWQLLSSGVAMKAILYPYNGSNYQIQVVRIDPKLMTASLQYDQQGKTIRQWAGNQSNSIVVNAGFFKEQNEPVGLLYLRGQRVDAHQVRPNGTGLLMLEDTGIKILDLTSNQLPTEAEMQNVVQTYPMLISKGKAVASNDLVKQARRTAIGLDKDKNIYLFTAEYSHLGLHDFANTLENSSLQLTEVLNLDGGGSTGIAIDAGGFQKVIDSQTVVPTVLIFNKQ